MNQPQSEVEKIAVIGSGTMGAGIAQVCLQAGYAVTLQDINAAQVQAAREQIGRFIGRAAEKGQFSREQAGRFIARLTVTTDPAEAAQGAAWVIEAIFESMDAKRALFSRFNELCPPATIFASNTSGLSISEIGAAGGRPDRTVGLHFFNPVPLMKLVEVIRGSETSDDVLQKAVALGEQLDKHVVVCQDAPNFIVNRINRPVGLEAQQLLQEGHTAQDIDLAMVLGASFKMGPLQTGDLSGLNIGLAVTENIFRETGDPRYRPVPLVRQLVRAGHTGKRAGRGFYLYPEGSTAPVPRRPSLALPAVPVPSGVAVVGEGYEARRWTGKLAQAGIRVAAGPAEADLVLVPEEAHAGDYREIFQQAVQSGPVQAVYALMAPLLPLDELAGAGDRAARVVGLHCPLPFIHDKFFEIRLGLDTGPAAAGLVAALLQKMNYKYVAGPETPAGIALRVICAMANEAAFALQEGLASAADIDTAVKLGMNYGLGPLEYADRLGLDRVLSTLEYLQAETGDPRYRPALLLRQMVRAGRLGTDAGRGFYQY